MTISIEKEGRNVHLPSNLPTLSYSPWCCLSLVCQVPFSSQCCLSVFSSINCFFHLSLVILFHHCLFPCPPNLICFLLLSFHLSLLSFTLVFLWQWMRDGGQLVDGCVSKILSAHRSFGNRSCKRTSVIFLLHPSLDISAVPCSSCSLIFYVVIHICIHIQVSL